MVKHLGQASKDMASAMGMKEFEVLRIPSLVESGYEVVDTATMSLSQRMIACLGNDKMADVQLMGDDGVKVNACRFVLGSASPNLQNMLYSGDKQDVVSIPHCRAKTLRALVEFSLSDMLNTAIWAETEPVEIVEDLIALAKLAEQHTLANLKSQVADVLAPCLEQLPSLACVAYNLADTKVTPELHAAALEVLRKKPYQAFVKGPGGEIGGIACLSPDKLDTIFRDSEVDAEEIFLFQCLQEWKKTNADLYANVDQICKMVAQNLDFSAMNASDIENIVMPSGVVDSGSLVSGLMTLAKAAEKKGISLPSSKRALTKHLAESITGSKGSKGRGRRFKKNDGSGPSSDESTTGESQAPDSDEKREETEQPSIIPIIHKEQISEPESEITKKPRSFKKSSIFKFFGSLKPHRSMKEDEEEESVDASPAEEASETAPAVAVNE